MKEPFLIAFSTTSSGAALPRAMETLDRVGFPNRIVGFVLPFCFVFNLTGTATYLPIAVLFVAQATGTELALSQHLLLFVVLAITSKGIAAVPRSSLIIIIGTLEAFDLPVSYVALLLSVELFLDMARTAVNIVGHGLAVVVVAWWQGIDLRHLKEVDDSSATPTEQKPAVKQTAFEKVHAHRRSSPAAPNHKRPNPRSKRF
jgi:proton glutamate symport protein